MSCVEPLIQEEQQKKAEALGAELAEYLTKREHMATQIAAGIAEPNCKDYAVIARKSVAITDELLKALAK